MSILFELGLSAGRTKQAETSLTDVISGTGAAGMGGKMLGEGIADKTIRNIHGTSLAAVKQRAFNPLFRAAHDPWLSENVSGVAPAAVEHLRSKSDSARKSLQAWLIGARSSSDVHRPGTLPNVSSFLQSALGGRQPDPFSSKTIPDTRGAFRKIIGGIRANRDNMLRSIKPKAGIGGMVAGGAAAGIPLLLSYLNGKSGQ